MARRFVAAAACERDDEMKMRPFGKLVPLDVAVRRLLAAAVPIRAVETVGLYDAIGRVSARSYVSPRDVPAFARATWDGYAVRSRDTVQARPGRPVGLKVTGEIFAEGSLSRTLGTGEAVAIATGGALPRGADAVAIVEVVKERGPVISLERPVPRGERVARPGDDFRKGSRLVTLGDVLDPALVSALAASGVTRVRVFRRPVVTAVPNGNELVVPGRSLRPGQIFETNNIALSAVVTAAGGILRPTPPVPDDPRRIEAAIRAALRTSDVVLVTGGSSVGEHDYLPTIFPRVGRLLFHGIAVRPGKPTLAAVKGRRLLLGMPGHPTSCLANGYWLLLPVLRRIARRPGPGWWDGTARMAELPRRPSPDLTTVVPLRVENGVGVPTFRDSSAITSLAHANAFALLPPGRRPVRRGETVAVRFLPPPIGEPAGAAP